MSFARHDPAAASGESEDAKVERFTRELMEKSGGRWLVGAIGVTLVAVGAYFVIKGLRATFRDELEPGGVGPFSHEAIVTLGRVGWAGRGVVMGLVGWFVTRAAIEFNPDEAKGIDGALRDATGSSLGALLRRLRRRRPHALRRVLRDLGAATTPDRRRLDTRFVDSHAPTAARSSASGSRYSRPSGSTTTRRRTR